MLPSLNTPIYELVLPISKEKIKFRPFLVKEQKILLLVNETQEGNFSTNNIKEIIKNCCLTPIDVDTLSQIDIEYFFLHLRARSISEVIDMKYRCNNILNDGEKCNNLMETQLNLLDISVDYKGASDIINLTNEVGIKLKYPDFSFIHNIDPEENILSITLEVIYNSIDYIFDDKNFYYKNETPKEEFIDFLENLNIEQYKKIEEYFTNLPTLSETIHLKCSKCGFDHNIKIEGLNNFLD